MWCTLVLYRIKYRFLVFLVSRRTHESIRFICNIRILHRDMIYFPRKWYVVGIAIRSRFLSSVILVFVIVVVLSTELVTERSNQKLQYDIHI